MKKMALMTAVTKRKLNRMLVQQRINQLIQSYDSLSLYRKKKIWWQRRRKKMKKIRKPTVCGISQSSLFLSCGKVA
jgi:hypothetical protein